MNWRLLLLVAGVFQVLVPPAFGAGRQLTGQHAPASTPAMSPAEAQKMFVVPEGFEVRLFASEPDVINPVAMTWDDKGRLWVVELYEYPLGAAPGTKPRDRIRILEDTDNDGKADKSTIFAEGLNLATGILLGNGGAYVGQAPEMLFLQDTDGDGKADKRTVVLNGFGLEDRHELLNGFTWGPDGWLYLTHGVFTRSNVGDPEDPSKPKVTTTAAVARFHPRTKKFEVVAEGTSNPWGVDFDRAGNPFVSACVIDHFFHMAPGGLFVRQGGTPPNPYAYELLPSIVDHKHHMAAYAGVNIYQGSQWPKEWLGQALMGNIHQNALNHDRLEPDGSSFKAKAEPDFLTTKDGWFMPVSIQTGPDGALWVMDWYDKYPCYQNANADPEGVDRERGRIWRVVYTGKNKGAPVPSRLDKSMELGKLATVELVKYLSHPNIWHRRMAQRLLSERQDAAAKKPLLALLDASVTPESKLAAFWTLHSAGLLDEETLDKLASSEDATMRLWAARFTGERGDPNETAMNRLKVLARDGDPSVRLAVTTAARQFTGGSLTVNTTPAKEASGADTGAILAGVLETSADGKDPLIPFMLWMAAEPQIGANPAGSLKWMSEHGMETMPLSGRLLVKIMRRICDTRNVEYLNAAVDFMEALPETAAPLLASALDGLVEGQRGKAMSPTRSTAQLLASWQKSPNAAVVQKSEQLGAVWGNAMAMKAIFGRILDPTAPEKERINAMRAARQLKNDAARDTILEVLGKNPPDSISIEAVSTLSEIGGDNVADELLKMFKNFSPGTKRAVIEALATRRRWAMPLLTAVEQSQIAASDLPVTVIRTLSNSGDDYVRNRAAKIIGRVRDANPDKLALIAVKRKMVTEGPVDLEAGHVIAQKTCFVCHKLHGEGADVGPDLTGVGRSSLDALLANVIDPNQIIGKGYENVEVETKDGRSLSGRLAEDTETRIKLLSAGPKEEVVAKSEITSMKVTEVSVMPEGLEQLPDADFRNLIWYILAPPKDGKELTPQLREALSTPVNGAGNPETDGESIALWNPDWRVFCPKFEGAPQKLDYEGLVNVLMTHPFSREKPAALERVVNVPEGMKSFFTFKVASHEKGDFELRVLVEGKEHLRQMIDRKGNKWKEVRLELSEYSGKKVKIRLENAANDWAYEFAYWADFKFSARP